MSPKTQIQVTVDQVIDVLRDKKPIGKRVAVIGSGASAIQFVPQIAPLVERLFKDYPDLEYVKDLRAHALPPNIEVREFFMKTGDYLGNP